MFSLKQRLFSLLSWQRLWLRHKVKAVDKRLGRAELRRVVQVRVYVGRCRKITVAEPLLYLLHRYAVGEQQTGAAMPLRYNKDKRKNPVFSRVSAFVVAYSIPFPTLIVNEKSVE